MKDKIIFLITITICIFFLIIGLHFKTLKCECISEPLEKEENVSNLFSSAEIVINLVNKERSYQNLEPVEYDQKLTNVATFKACDMVSKNYFSHKDLDDRYIWFYIKKAGIKYENAGENLARNFGNDWLLAMKLFMDSEKHRDNILNKEYEKIGIGICKGYLVQLFTDNYEN